jgi:hypothetical protein
VGINIAINSAMMEITTKSSINVKPFALCTMLPLLFALATGVYQEASQIESPGSLPLS